MNRMKNLFLCLFCLLPSLAIGQASTSTSSSSVGTGASYASFAWTSLAIGPSQLVTGDRGTCTIPAAPYPTCTPPNGSGTQADPFGYTCSSAGLPLSGCTLSGTTFVVPAGSTNINIHVHRQTAAAVVPVAGSSASVPFGPWVPIGSGLGIALLALVLRRKRRLKEQGQASDGK